MLTGPQINKSALLQSLVGGFSSEVSLPLYSEAMTLMLSQKYSKAEKVLTTALQQEPENADLLAALGLAQKAQGKRFLHYEYYKKALSIDSRCLLALIATWANQCSYKQTQLARRTASKFLKHRFLSEAHLLLVTRAVLKDQSYVQALSLLEMAEKLFPDSQVVKTYLALTYLKSASTIKTVSYFAKENPLKFSNLFALKVFFELWWLNLLAILLYLLVMFYINPVLVVVFIVMFILATIVFLAGVMLYFAVRFLLVEFCPGRLISFNNWIAANERSRA